MKKVGLSFSPIAISLTVITIVIFWVGSNMNWGEKRWHKLLNIDGVGYYSYLPAIFIYQDLNFDFYDKVKNNNPRPQLDFAFKSKTGSGIINKYYSGTALCNLPFFLTAHWLSTINGQSSDGYSVYYLLSIQIAAFFYLIIGLVFVSQILKFYIASERIRAIVLLMVLFGSNLFYYVVHEPYMSHVFSFAFVNLFVLSILSYLKSHKGKWVLISAFALGVVILIRPVNIIVLMAIPFICGDFKTLKNILASLIKKPWNLLGSLLIFAVIVSIQLIIYKIQTGSFIVYSYGNEGLDFSNPHIFNFLFSYRKGFFVWAPLMFLSLLGLKYILKHSLFQFITWLVFILFVTYILSSWWMWYYGGSFGSRVMVDYLVFFSIPLALLIQKTNFPKIVVTILISLCLITQIQTFQYIKGYIHWSQMNQEWYWDNFLRIDKVFDKADKPWGDAE